MKKEFVLPVKVIPKAHKSEIVGWENDDLKVRLKAVPEKGEANEELIRFFSKLLKLPKSGVTLLSGAKSRHKKLLVQGMTLDEFYAFLGN